MSRSAALREHDQIIVLHDVTWEDYEHMLAMRGDKSAPRIAYLEGELEIMSPSKDHEQIKSFIGCLLETWCIDLDIELTPFGSGGTFARAERSRILPDLDLALLASMLGHDTLTQAVRAFRRALEAERHA